MNLIRFNQHPAFSSLFDNFEKPFTHDFANSSKNIPMVNVKDIDNSFIVELAAPGMEKKDFSIKLESNKLTISSNKKEEKVDENTNYTIKEYSFNSFSRSFTLPKNTEFEQINADYKNGVLSISIPKREEEAKLNREIKIS